MTKLGKVTKTVQVPGKFAQAIFLMKYNLLSTGAFVFRKTPLFKPVLAMLNGVDKALFTVLPPIRRWAWLSVIELRKPKKSKK